MWLPQWCDSILYNDVYKAQIPAINSKERLAGRRKHRIITNLRGISRIERKMCLPPHGNDLNQMDYILINKFPKSFRECYCQKNNLLGPKETVNVQNLKWHFFPSPYVRSMLKKST